MDVVVREPRLLERIFSAGYAEHTRGHFASYALVCKTWCEPALDVLWRKIEASKMPCLFRLLSPLKKIKREPKSSMKDFKLLREPTLEGWQRFQYYARRVRVLSYMRTNMTTDYTHRMDATAYDALDLIRAHSPVFPKLHTFHVDTSLSGSTLFLHSSIRNLRITFSTGADFDDDVSFNVEQNRDFLHQVTSLRVLDLTNLSVSVDGASFRFSIIGHSQELWPICPLEEDIVQLLTQQACLQKLSLPRFWVTTKVVNALSHLEYLKSISVTPGSYNGHPLESVNFYPLSSQDADVLKPALPSLQRLTLSVPYTTFHSFLNRWVTPHSAFTSPLLDLDLCSQILESPTALQEVLQSIATCCPGIKTLSVSSLRSSSIYSSDPLTYGFDGGSIGTAAPPPEGWSLKTLLPFRVSLTTIAPLFPLTQLRHLKLHHNLPAAFSVSDLETLATNFRHLTLLDLFSNPCSVIRATTPEIQYDEVILNPEDYAQKYIFDLRTALRVFGSLCPHLRSLSVFICADSGITEQQSYTIYPPTSLAIPSPSSNRLFPRLRSLNFGTSPISGSEASLVGILCEYIGQDVHISSGGRNGSFKSSNSKGAYANRLFQGGKVPEPIPDHTGKPNLGDAKSKLWDLDNNEEPLGDDFAVVVTETGEPLSLGLEFMQPDEFGVKCLPGVYGVYVKRTDIVRVGSKSSSAYPEWSKKWSKVDKMLPYAVRIFEQEKERAEKD